MASRVNEKSAGRPRERAATRVRAQLREAQAVDLAVSGLGYAEIGKTLGVTESAAYKMIQKALRKIADEQFSDRRVLLARELKLLDRLTQANLRGALGGDFRAAQVVLKAQDNRIRLLGLDSPIKVEATVRSQQDEEIEALLRELGTDKLGARRT